MNAAVWIVQVLLALAFGAAGLMKMTQPREKLQTNLKWVEDFAPNTIKGIGALEALAAVGLILPFLTGILSVLTPLAAAGLILTMIGAIITHIRRGESPMDVLWLSRTEQLNSRHPFPNPLSTIQPTKGIRHLNFANRQGKTPLEYDRCNNSQLR